MGIKNLNTFLRKKCPTVFKQDKVSSFSNKIIAIDISLFVFKYKSVYNNDWLRALLNFGHTFGHAIEAGVGFGKWLHGEAVEVGMLLAMRMSVLSDFVPQSDCDRLRALLVRVGLPIEAPNLGRDNYLGLMGFDKKVLDGKLRLILLKQLGRAYVSADFSPDILNKVLDEIGS